MKKQLLNIKNQLADHIEVIDNIYGSSEHKKRLTLYNNRSAQSADSEDRESWRGGNQKSVGKVTKPRAIADGPRLGIHVGKEHTISESLEKYAKSLGLGAAQIFVANPRAQRMNNIDYEEV